MFARFDFSKMRERDDEANRPVAAHRKAADVVEENHAADAGFIRRLNQQRADHHVRAARLVDDGGAKPVVLITKGLQLLGHSAATEIRPAAHHHARRLAAGVRIDDLDAFQIM